ncbi:hypothetical protein E0L36_03745 [Streptomyces sp. AJS327]|uniref:hypothetical protein n=1 Tax=Streptomyces sp. AJS327 TaxID=2545265 RepID=UPI0015DFBCEC|nr:hypothetical protein [Streptomyces sp. AJS327]MBA0050042.1 hypothetical protein [Streptomyces sp. AJS327]
MTFRVDTMAVGEGDQANRGGLTIAADGSYAARLNTRGGRGCYPERWTLSGPEPYVVPLPGGQPESPDSPLLPLADGHVLIARRGVGRHRLALLYPTGPGTGERPLGMVRGERLRLLPPAPCGRRAYAVTIGEFSTSVWLLVGGATGAPELVADVAGQCGGGSWLDRDGRLLALDRRDPHGAHGSSPLKTVVVDLARGGETSPLLQISEESDDQLLLADPDTGLALIRSNAPGEERLGWGVLGSHRPVRFPEGLRSPRVRLTPFAVQPGQQLQPESCAVAFRAEAVSESAEPPERPSARDPEAADHRPEAGPAPRRPWLAVWRPDWREPLHLTAPEGWLTGSGLWTSDGELRLPRVTASTPCELSRFSAAALEAARRTARETAVQEAAAREPLAAPEGRAPDGETAAEGAASDMAARWPRTPPGATEAGPRPEHPPDRAQPPEYGYGATSVTATAQLRMSIRVREWAAGRAEAARVRRVDARPEGTPPREVTPEGLDGPDRPDSPGQEANPWFSPGDTEGFRPVPLQQAPVALNS